MKAIINKLAQATPGMSAAGFETAYRKEHPAAESLNPENIRQAFTTYNTAARKIRRVKQAREGTVGPDRTPR